MIGFFVAGANSPKMHCKNKTLLRVNLICVAKDLQVLDGKPNKSIRIPAGRFSGHGVLLRLILVNHLSLSWVIFM